MRPAEEIKRLIKDLNDKTSAKMDERVLKDVLFALEESKKASALRQPNIRRIIMKNQVTKIATVLAVVLGLGAIAVVGVNVGKIYYKGKTDDGTHYIFYSEGGEDEGFTLMDASGVTAEQAQTDLEEMKILSQQGKRELLNVAETIIGTYRLKTHKYRYQLSDGRTSDMGEAADDMPMYSQEQWKEFSPQLKEFRQLQKAGPGEDLGTYEETVEGRVFSFKRERYFLNDGTEVIWSVGTPK